MTHSLGHLEKVKGTEGELCDSPGHTTASRMALLSLSCFFAFDLICLVWFFWGCYLLNFGVFFEGVAKAEDGFGGTGRLMGSGRIM